MNNKMIILLYYIFSISDMYNLFIIKSNRRKYTDLFAIKIYQLILERY